ncbi:hypothetical protein HYC85_023439 [Camellia sinensis]|uniref:Cytochrome b5 heme-binding domain-containing protein n=1 Tax=Camellia sinensis TaxID=4442 RepID=A0A7J7GEM0_CAMSI|nr:hypothetical protein HYC85_023439 [Camellia sinensis]
MPTLTKLYTMREASQHNTKDDCWVVIDGKIPLDDIGSSDGGGEGEVAPPVNRRKSSFWSVFRMQKSKECKEEREDGKSKIEIEAEENYAHQVMMMRSRSVCVPIASDSSTGNMRSSSVYDVSTYLDEHPGGDDVMVAATGKDATDEFEDAGHSKSARELMETFCIGELDPASPPAIIPELEIPSKKKQLEDLTKQYWTVPVTVVGASVVFIAALYCWHRK